jgi:hypothetical protein
MATSFQINPTTRGYTVQPMTAVAQVQRGRDELLTSSHSDRVSEALRMPGTARNCAATMWDVAHRGQLRTRHGPRHTVSEQH